LLNDELTAAPEAFREHVRNAICSWFAQAPAMLARRQLTQASEHALTMGLEIEAIRLSHAASSDRASQALDRFLSSARTAVEVWDRDGKGLDPADVWHEPAIALQRNFQLQERLWSAGRLAGADFMLGHELLTRDTLTNLARSLGLRPPVQPRPSELLVAANLEATSEPSTQGDRRPHAAAPHHQRETPP
jgi:hypothetical protein